jgi:hypothetical protein
LEGNKCSMYLVNTGFSAVEILEGTVVGEFHEVEENSLCAIENCEMEPGMQDACQECHLTGLCDKQCVICKKFGKCRKFQFSQNGGNVMNLAKREEKMAHVKGFV